MPAIQVNLTAAQSAVSPGSLASGDKYSALRDIFSVQSDVLNSSSENLILNPLSESINPTVAAASTSNQPDMFLKPSKENIANTSSENLLNTSLNRSVDPSTSSEPSVNQNSGAYEDFWSVPPESLKSVVPQIIPWTQSNTEDDFGDFADFSEPPSKPNSERGSSFPIVTVPVSLPKGREEQNSLDFDEWSLPVTEDSIIRFSSLTMFYLQKFMFLNLHPPIYSLFRRGVLEL